MRSEPGRASQSLLEAFKAADALENDAIEVSTITSLKAARAHRQRMEGQLAKACEQAAAGDAGPGKHLIDMLEKLHLHWPAAFAHGYG